MPDLSALSTEQLIGELLSRQRPAPGEMTVTHVRANMDSLEIGTAGRGGVVKVYFDAGAPDDEIRMRIDAAFRARAYAQLKMEV